MFKLIDKLICLFVALPPVYLALRFIYWYLKSEMEDREVPDEEMPA